MDQLIIKRIASFGNAIASLKEAVEKTDVDPVFRRDTALLRFELMVDDRNRMVHDYNERFADRLFEHVMNAYLPVLARL